MSLHKHPDEASASASLRVSLSADPRVASLHSSLSRRSQYGSLARRGQSVNANTDDGNSNDSADDKDEDMRDRQDAINQEHPFGFRPWKGALYKKSRSIERATEDNIRESPSSRPAQRQCYLGNILWFIVFGIPLACVYTLASGLMLLLTLGKGKDHALLLFRAAGYLLYPFGKWIERNNLSAQAESETWWWMSASLSLPTTSFLHRNTLSSTLLSTHDDPSEFENDITPLLTSFSSNSSLLLAHSQLQAIHRFRGYTRLVFSIVVMLLAAPPTLLVAMLCWMGVFTLPMAKVTHILLRNLFRNPLSLDIHLRRATSPSTYINDQTVLLLCIYRAMGWKYYKYTYDGVNILFINLMPLVFVLLLNGWIVEPILGIHSALSEPVVVFTLSMASVVPLSYFIGMAVASLSMQLSPASGAVITATFGSIIDIILYCIALTEHKSELVEGSIVGSFIAALLLLPGLSMIAGGFRQKEQRFNARSAGVSSTMLITSVMGAFVPTFFYQAYGTFELRCKSCPTISDSPGAPLVCSGCFYEIIDPSDDDVYKQTVVPLSHVCAALLPLMYIIGLIFTLRTHRKHIYTQRQPTSQLSVDHTPQQTGPSRNLINSGTTKPSADLPSPLSNLPQSAQSYELTSSDATTGVKHIDTNAGPSLTVNEPPKSSTSSTITPTMPNRLQHHPTLVPGSDGPIFLDTPIAKPRRMSMPHLGYSKKFNKSNSVYLQPTDPNLLYFKQGPVTSERPSHLSKQLTKVDEHSDGSVRSTHSPERRQSHLGVEIPDPTSLSVSTDMHHLPLGSNPALWRDDVASVTENTSAYMVAPGENSTTADHTAHANLISPTTTTGRGQGNANDGHEGGGHSAPEWSKNKSTFILLVCTALFSMTAELLVNSVESVVDTRPGAARFLGVAVFGLVPSITEFVNAIAFAIQGNIALSLEIGSAYAVQIALVQIPCVFAFSTWYNHGKLLLPEYTQDMFTLIFPQFDIYAVLFAVFLLSYVYIEGKTNYFKGSMLTLAYLVWLAAYYYASFKGISDRGPTSTPILLGFPSSDASNQKL